MPFCTAVYRQLRKQGSPIRTNDTWMAALVLQPSLSLFDRDRHFEALPQLLRREPETHTP